MHLGVVDPVWMTLCDRLLECAAGFLRSIDSFWVSIAAEKGKIIHEKHGAPKRQSKTPPKPMSLEPLPRKKIVASTGKLSEQTHHFDHDFLRTTELFFLKKDIKNSG